MCVCFFVIGAALNVKSINLNKKSNSDKHFTSDYEVEDLVVRRGKAFDITILFDREIDKETDIISLQFVVGEYLLISKPLKCASWQI